MEISRDYTYYKEHAQDVNHLSDYGGEEEEGVLLKYVPFRIAPSVVGAETTATTSPSSRDNDLVGTQTFTLRDVPEGYVTRNEGYEPACWVDDTILPEPHLFLIHITMGNET